MAEKSENKKSKSTTSEKKAKNTAKESASEEGLQEAYKTWAEFASGIGGEVAKLMRDSLVRQVEFQRRFIRSLDAGESYPPKGGGEESIYKGRDYFEKTYLEITDFSSKMGKVIEDALLKNWDVNKDLMRFWQSYMEKSASFATGAEKIWTDALERIKSSEGKYTIENYMEELRRVHFSWLDAYSRMLKETMATPPFASLIGKSLDSFLDMRKSSGESTDQILRNLNLPTKSDLDDIYKRMNELRKKVSDLSKEVRKLSKKQV